MARQPNTDTSSATIGFEATALRGIEADFGPEHADTFRRDLHPDIRAGSLLGNSSCNATATALRDSVSLQIRGTLQVVTQR